MSDGSSGPGPAQPADAGDDEPTRVMWSRDPGGRADPAGPSQPPAADAGSPYAPTYVPPTEAVSPYAPTEAVSPYAPTYVPPTEAGPRYRPAHSRPPQPPADTAASYVPTYVPPRDEPPWAPAGVPPPDESPWESASVPPATAAPSYTPTSVPPRQPPVDAAAPYAPSYGPPRDAATANPSSEVVRYGPGVPVSQAGVTAEQVWRTGRLPEPERRPGRLRRVGGVALTVILLAAAGVVLFLRFHHAPFGVTAVAIIKQTKTACGVDLTGQITTNGSAGTVSYQWVFRPQVQAPQPLNQSVIAGQHAAYVTVAIEGEGRGSASQTVTLQVLGPGTGTATARVSVSC
jgi:hypothetical protein